MIRQLDEHTLVGSQIAATDIAGLAAQGVTLIVNNRPDGEDAEQPPATEIEAATKAAGIAYRFVPVRYGIGPAEIAAMGEAIRAAGDGKLLAFCRSGSRSALTWALARRAGGASAENVTQALLAAGIDPAPITHLL